jgi:molybdopterin synthase sulfur carrier subunit
MSIRVYIPTPYRDLTTGQGHVHAEGGTIAELVVDLDRRYPGLGKRVSVDGSIRHHVNVFVNGQEMRGLDGDHTPLTDGDEVAFIPALVGGQSYQPSNDGLTS